MLLFESLSFQKGSEIFSDPDFCQVMDSHMEYLKVTGNITYRDIPQEYLGMYYGDFYAILIGFEIDPQYHRIILLANGYTSPYQYHGENIQVMIPDLGIVEKILNIYGTSRKKWNDVVGQ